VTQAAQLLDEYKMVRFNRDSGNLAVVSQGRVAAHYYIQAESVATFNEMLERTGSVDDAFLMRVICSATEFRNMRFGEWKAFKTADLDRCLDLNEVNTSTQRITSVEGNRQGVVSIRRGHAHRAATKNGGVVVVFVLVVVVGVVVASLTWLPPA
jgi:hypothetical protein